MNQDNIKNVFGQIIPDMSAKERMLENILNTAAKRSGRSILSFNLRKAIPALALAAVFAVGIFALNFRNTPLHSGLINTESSAAGEENTTDANSLNGSEDMAAPMLSQIQIENRHYIPMSDYAEEFGFPAAISEQDIGAKLTMIEKSSDKSLIGCEVFSYLPAGSEAVVAVKRNNGYELYRFFTFESYINNQDEDAIEYLKLYGINSPEDIAKIQFIGYSEKSKVEGNNNIIGEITDRNEIAEFYSFYSVLKNSSDKYFEKLFGGTISNGNNRTNSYTQKDEFPDAEGVDPIAPNYMPTPDYNRATETSSIYPDIAEDMPLTGNETPEWVIPYRDNTAGLTDIGGTEPVTVTPAKGSAGIALYNPVTIRIYNKNGVYFEVTYYKNIGFISRYEITEEFAAFIENHIQ